jgi:hypothetical protein
VRFRIRLRKRRTPVDEERIARRASRLSDQFITCRGLLPTTVCEKISSCLDRSIRKPGAKDFPQLVVLHRFLVRQVFDSNSTHDKLRELEAVARDRLADAPASSLDQAGKRLYRSDVALDLKNILKLRVGFLVHSPIQKHSESILSAEQHA